MVAQQTLILIFLFINKIKLISIEASYLKQQWNPGDKLYFQDWILARKLIRNWNIVRGSSLHWILLSPITDSDKQSIIGNDKHQSFTDNIIHTLYINNKHYLHISCFMYTKIREHIYRQEQMTSLYIIELCYKHMSSCINQML